MFFLYAASSEFALKNGLIKCGSTIYPVHRMRCYNTGDAPGIGLEKWYLGIWQVISKSRKELLSLERFMHNKFASFRQTRSNGTSTEWFNVSYDDLAAFLNSQPFVIRQLTIEEINIIQKKSELPPSLQDMDEIKEENELSADQKNTESASTLKRKFFDTFLTGKPPRRIQSELWTLFETICHNDVLLEKIYKGIVQWPTGTGKTIAMLMMVVQAKERCARNGTIYRGLLVSPKNDIFATICSEFNKLSEFGIDLYDGSHGKLSHITVPTNRHIVVMACPQSLLINETGMKTLPSMTHVHYDEVHRITGDLYFRLLKEMLDKWDTQFLTGTSATPKTSSPEQHRKLAELFGDPYVSIHRCEVDEAVREGWIATPRFTVSTIPNEDIGAHVKAVALALKRTIQKKKDAGLWRGGKCIVYLPSVLAAKTAAAEAIKCIPDVSVYLATDGERTDKEFVDAVPDGTVRIMFACDRYREGSDIKGLEMTSVLIGESISAYILIQIQGRALRTDYQGKEGWCLIVSPCDDGETEQDVLERIALDIITFIGDARPLVKKDFEKYVETYFGDVEVGGTIISKEETVARVQAAYVRREFAKRNPKERYYSIRKLNAEMGIRSRNEYFARADEHPNFIQDPKMYFSEWWVSWYDFIGVDCSSFPPTKADWVIACKNRSLMTRTDYEQKRDYNLPENPCEMYSDFTNWDKEMGVEDEIVW